MKVRIRDYEQIWKAFDLVCKSKNLYNFTNYGVRQYFINYGDIIQYSDLCYDLKDRKDSNGNSPFRELPAAISQNVIRQLSTNWYSFSKGLQEFNKNPSKFTGRPRIPNYIKNNIVNVVLMDVDRCFRMKQHTIHFTKNVLNPVRVPRLIRRKKIKQIRIVPHHNVFDLEFVYEIQDPDLTDTNGKALAIDIGLDNLITSVNNAGFLPFIINGKIIKSINRNYNRQKGYFQSRLPKGQFNSRKLMKLGLKRQDRLRDQMHKITTAIIRFCVMNNIRTIVIGRNKGIKQKSNMGKVNNQNFVSVPYYKMYRMLEYKCELNDIEYIEVQEAYTSKCSAFDLEPIGKQSVYCGKRISRGQFQTKSGAIVNADVNAAYNIYRLGTNRKILKPIAHPVKFTVGSRGIGSRVIK